MNKKVFENGIVYLGDCLEILPEIKEKSCEIAITSPPYNLNNSEILKKSFDQQKKHSNTSCYMKKKINDWYDDNLSSNDYMNQQKKVINLLHSVCTSSIFYNHKTLYRWHSRYNKIRNESHIDDPYHWLQDFPIWCKIIWNRLKIDNPVKNRYHQQYEYIYQLYKPTKHNNYLNLTNIWNIPPTKNKHHVCSFPSKLVDNAMLTTTEINDIVLDPYLGSGTTAIQAIKHNRKFIGIEKNKEYFNLACDRIADEERQYCLF